MSVLLDEFSKQSLKAGKRITPVFGKMNIVFHEESFIFGRQNCFANSLSLGSVRFDQRLT